MDDDEKDRAKRASRNKSEKKRRDQFNVLIKELSTMLQGSAHKMDKSTVLQRTIDFLQKQKELSAQTDACEIRQDWKPSFLSNEEFTQLMLEALDGFLIALTADGNIIYISDSVSSLLGHLPSDLVDQNILNFLPEQEHAEVYKLLSNQMLMTDPVTRDYLNNQNHVEFCCHLSRGSLDPKEPPMYEYVKFVGSFRFHNIVPMTSCNGFESAISRSFRSAAKEQVCLVATGRLVIPQFLKELCNVEESCEEFTSRHSLEWKFLFLDHRAPPIIGYLPFEVLGTSGYDYYHVDDLELLARCHEHLMQFGKGKSCYYRFLTKGQRWIWLQTHYYITYHQWNSKPEFIVCMHTVVSYVEVRSERRREQGLEESSPEILPPPALKTQNCRQCENAQDIAIERLSGSRPCSVSSPSSLKSSHTGLSDTPSTQSKVRTEASTPSRQSVNTSLQDKSAQRPQQGGTQALMAMPPSPDAHQQQPAVISTQQAPSQPMYQCPAQLGVMHQLKEQLEERTRILQANIKTQQEELHHIKEQLQFVHDSNLQMMLQQPNSLAFNTLDHQDQGQQQQQQQQPGNVMQSPCLSSKQMQALVDSELLSQQLSSSQHVLREPNVKSVPVQQQFVKGSQLQQASLQIHSHTSRVTPLFGNPMMFAQTPTVPCPIPLPSDVSQSHSTPEYGHDRQLRLFFNQPIHPIMPNNSGTEQPSQNNTAREQAKFIQDQQMLTALTMQPTSCSAIIVPSPSSMAIQHPGFSSHQQASIQQQHSHHPLQLQQQHQYLQQVPLSGMMQGDQSQPLFLGSAPQVNLGYLSQHQTRGTQSNTSGLSDLPNIQLPR
ncbi:neuronal PAS domain-containing protein 2 isoform X1 [Chiloscyllium plagiosum]|uniref:neuronal PAS domain-containing protein 2 isoform X1 n=2 Tax=Chiloscyllium plagiosum TaxID=36176 RepID=UPI001CB813FD|nr:neuronal PAS domain-containing protein 2 isoform X1 [Chiloscyllium plagiosum]XP_043561066.1 neuronal PAS domain-containing protein 2 isoform X1 [Chiloscyllium plagiosum]XP_043561067.1 neuronal PAS domain-containing protein 2 isoform X1 [Chiloscyllium plagiosum]XP_043561068.1 neuronal PAS domain-containing protein 2 isoform X1 [Chiloscyllium plagiosum]